MMKHKVTVKYNRNDWDLHTLISGESIGKSSEDDDEEYTSSLTESTSLESMSSTPSSPMSKRKLTKETKTK